MQRKPIKTPLRSVTLTPRVDNISLNLKKFGGIAQVARQNGKDLSPLEISEKLVAKRLPALKNYLQKRGADVSQIEQMPIEDIAATVQAERLDQIREKIQSKEAEIMNNAPVIENRDVVLKSTDVPATQSENTGVFYGNANLKDPDAQLVAEPTATNAPELMETGLILPDGDGVKIGLRKAKDAGGYFTTEGKTLVYWGSGLVDPNLAHEAILAEEEEIAGFDLDPDNFLGGDILGALVQVGQNALQKANEKRVEKGKKPVLKFLEPRTGRETTASAGSSIFEQATAEAMEKVTEIKKKEEIKKMLPFIIIVVVILIVIVTLVARRK